MKINLNHIFKTIKGETLTQPTLEQRIAALEMQLKNHSVPLPQVPGTEDMTLKEVCLAALQANFDDEKQLSATEKVARYSLATDIFKAKESIELASEEITLLKKLVGKGFTMLIVGQAYELLDPPDSGKQ